MQSLIWGGIPLQLHQKTKSETVCILKEQKYSFTILFQRDVNSSVKRLATWAPCSTSHWYITRVRPDERDIARRPFVRHVCSGGRERSSTNPQGLTKSVKLEESNGQSCVEHPIQNKGKTIASFISHHKEGSPFAMAVEQTTPKRSGLKQQPFI